MPKRLYLCAIGAVLLVWTLLAASYIRVTPFNERAYDPDGHVAYTQLIYKTKALPKPYDEWETYHPPLYYLINTALSPQSQSHTDYVRYMSVAYGGIFLVLAALCMSWLTKNLLSIVLGLLLICTTPSFLYLFTAYNNDSLAILLSAAFLTASAAYVRSGSQRLLYAVTAIVTAGLYTKLTVAFAFGAAVMAGLVLYQSRRPLQDRIVRLAQHSALGCLFFTPWIFGHNLALTGKLFPTNFENGLNPILQLANHGWGFLAAHPFTMELWKGPYTYATDYSVWEKQSYVANTITTSLYGEFVHPETATPWAWLMIASTLILLATAACLAWKRPYARYLAGLIGAALLIQAAYVVYSPYGCSADFRYILWTLLPLYAIIVAVLADQKGRDGRPLAYGLLSLSVLAVMLTHAMFYYSLLQPPSI